MPSSPGIHELFFVKTKREFSEFMDLVEIDQKSVILGELPVVQDILSIVRISD